MFSVVRQNGKNYEALANSLEEKTVAQCRNFFTNYKRKLNLPRIIAEYETRHVSMGMGEWEIRMEWEYDRLEWNGSMTNWNGMEVWQIEGRVKWEYDISVEESVCARMEWEYDSMTV